MEPRNIHHSTGGRCRTGRVLVGGQEAQLRAVGQADGVAGQRDPEILFSNIYDVRPEVFRLDFGGRQEDLRIACHDRVFKGFKCKIPGRTYLAAFEDVSDQLANVPAQVFLVFKKMFFRPGVKILLRQRGNIVFLVFPFAAGFVIIAVPRICLPGVLTAGHLFFMLIALRTQFCGVSNEHVHFFQVEIGFVIPAGQ